MDRIVTEVVAFRQVFKRFTERTRQVVVLAQEEARALGHEYLGTEHILLGLLRDEEGVAGRILAQLGVTADEVRAEVSQSVGPGKGGAATGQIPFTPRAKKVLELALREALSLGHNFIGTEHVLLGLVHENDGVAARILESRGAGAEPVRACVAAELGVRPEAIGAARFGRRFRRGTVSTVASARASWEYRVEHRDRIETEWLNELGAEGWELVDISRDTLVFKRRCLRPGSLSAAG
jgi:ATP-dependent Clp protease ATP-binding subunit ClpA